MKIEIDGEVYQELQKLGIAFEDTPNDVLRRLLKLEKEPEPRKPKPSKHEIKEPSPGSYGTKNDSNVAKIIHELGAKTPFCHPAFLTFLIDKHNDTRGNYKVSMIVPFMERFNLVLPAKRYWNPWMKEPYKGAENGLVSCTRTIEHFRQCRMFGCWNGKDSKTGCHDFSCKYHPNNDDPIQAICDLRKGVIWKRRNPKSAFSYGTKYLDAVKEDLLRGDAIPLKPLLRVFYPKSTYGKSLADRFRDEFHIDDKEINQLFQIQ